MLATFSDWGWDRSALVRAAKQDRRGSHSLSWKNLTTSSRLKACSDLVTVVAMFEGKQLRWKPRSPPGWNAPSESSFFAKLQRRRRYFDKIYVCMQAIRSSWRAPLLSRFKHTQSSNNPAPADLLAEVNRSRRRSADSASSSKASLPTPQDLLALRPRLKRQRRRTDTEWAHEYARKFQAGIGSIERAFTLPQLEHLAKELQLQVHGQHASYRKRELATQLVKSAEGWGWGDPQALLDKVKKKSNVPPHKQGASTSTLSAFPINKKFNHLGGTDVDLSPAELFLSWPTGMPHCIRTSRNMC